MNLHIVVPDHVVTTSPDTALLDDVTHAFGISTIGFDITAHDDVATGAGYEAAASEGGDEDADEDDLEDEDEDEDEDDEDDDEDDEEEDDDEDEEEVEDEDLQTGMGERG